MTHFFVKKSLSKALTTFNLLTFLTLKTVTFCTKDQSIKSFKNDDIKLK